MDIIFHEKQEGALCAQHSLNNLLQGPYFTAVELADIARQLDNYERTCMAAGGTDTAEYQQFLAQPSENMNDSGFFSVQVIRKALENFNISLISMESDSSDAVAAKQNPLKFKAFICNYQSHWLTVRKLGQQWFNLNSTLSTPEVLSDTYLALYLAQLATEGYSIFLVSGVLPNCEADEALQYMRITQPPNHNLQGTSNIAGSSGIQSEEQQIQAAIALSLSPGGCSPLSKEPAQLTPEQLRQKRIAHFDKSCS